MHLPLMLAALSARAPALGLAAGSLSVEYVLNWGGFVNHSFRATDGHATRHVKLATEPEMRAGLQRWRAVHDLLEQRYHAPRMLGWIDVPEAGAAGPVFEWVEGTVPDPLSRERLAQILPVVRRLHDDPELAARLAADEKDAPRRCADVYLQTYNDRFLADLAFIAEHRPPFITLERLAWMRVEAERLRDAVEGRCAAAFDAPADRPTHGDLWCNNFLVTAPGEWLLLDWDGLALGDPALDLAMLLGPAPARIRPADPGDAGRIPPPMRERLALYARASLLDWIIDPLSDWIDAERLPDIRDRVRAEKERVHREAVREYEERYV